MHKSIALVAPVVFLIASGCNEKKPIQLLELTSPNGVVATNGTVLSSEVPIGMTITRNIVVRSKFDMPLNNLRVVTSCGCTKAVLDADSFKPDEERVLTSVYEAGNAAESKKVNVRIFSQDVQQGPFEIGFLFKSEPRLDDFRVRASSKQFLFDRRWEEKMTLEESVKLMLGENVPAELQASSSSDLIKVSLNKDQLSVQLNNPAVGVLDEFVEVSYVLGQDKYALKIPVKISITPPITVEPNRLDFGSVPAGEDMVGEFLIVSETNGKPMVEADGDWQLKAITRSDDDDRTWKVEVGLAAIAGKAIRFGNVVVRGDWDGPELRVPILGCQANE